MSIRISNNKAPLWSAYAQQFFDSNRFGCPFRPEMLVPELDLERGSDFVVVAGGDGCTIRCRDIFLSTVRKEDLAGLATRLGMRDVHPHTPNLLNLLCAHLWEKFVLRGHDAAAASMNSTVTWWGLSQVNPRQCPDSIPASPPAHQAPVEPAIRQVNNFDAASNRNSSDTATAAPNKAFKTGKRSAFVSVERCSKQTYRSSVKKIQAATAVEAKPRIGDTVVLKRGRDEMLQYSGKEATVIAYPKEGDAMTVYVGSKRIKWSKRECARPLPELKEHVWVAIFRFLGSPDEQGGSANAEEEELLWVRDAVKLHTQLATVSQSWRIICNRNLPAIMGRMNANLDALPTKNIVPFVQWICKHKLAMGVLKFHAGLEDLLLLVELLTKANTAKLTTVRAFVDKEYCRLNCKSSRWINSAYEARANHEDHLVDLTKGSCGVRFEEKAQVLGVPAGDMTQKQFHDILALQCPNLQHLSLTVTMPVRRGERVSCSEYLSSSLFSMQSITKLEVSLGVDFNARSSGPVNGMLFHKMIKNLPGLTDLSIKCDYGEIFHNRRFLIISPTLKNLDTTGLSKCVWVSCECPELERFECNGSAYGNGTRPIFPSSDLDYIESFEDSFVRRGDLRVNAGRVAFSGLDIPDNCECVLRGYQRPQNDWVLEANCSARFETW